MGAGLFDHVGTAHGLNRHLVAGMSNPNAQTVALDQLAAFVGYVIRHFGRVHRPVNQPGERFDLSKRALRAGPGTRSNEMVVLAGIACHLEGVI